MGGVRKKRINASASRAWSRGCDVVDQNQAFSFGPSRSGSGAGEGLYLAAVGSSIRAS